MQIFSLFIYIFAKAISLDKKRSRQLLRPKNNAVVTTLIGVIATCTVGNVNVPLAQWSDYAMIHITFQLGVSISVEHMFLKYLTRT